MSLEHLNRMALGHALLANLFASVTQNDSHPDLDLAAEHGLEAVDALELARVAEKSDSPLESVMHAHNSVSHAKKLSHILARYYPDTRESRKAHFIVSGLNKVAIEHEQSHYGFMG